MLARVVPVGAAIENSIGCGAGAARRHAKKAAALAAAATTAITAAMASGAFDLE